MVSRTYHLLVLALVAAVLTACAKSEKPRTELVLVADTDIPDLDLIRFEVSGDQRSESEEAPPREDGEPLTLGLILDKGPTGPLAVSAQGVRNGQMVIERRAVVSFVPGKTLVVELHLLASCVARFCLGDRTCGERGCMSSELSSEQLPEWSGAPPAIGGTLLADAGGGSSEGGQSDAAAATDGGSDAGVAVSNTVTCGPDTQVDLSSDVDHCGNCATSCKTSGRNMVAVCMAGECAEECRTLYGDCDDKPSNGCEQSLSVSTSCGMCGVRCAAGTYCLFGTCR